MVSILSGVLGKKRKLKNNSVEKTIHEIEIIPAKFLRKTDDGKYVLRCLVDINYYEDRMFDELSLMGIKNPNYILIGIIIGKGFMQVNFIDANEFENTFNKKWKTLNK